MKIDPRVGLHRRSCGRCRYQCNGSAGERCPNCGAYSEDFGPVFYGRECRFVTMATRKATGALVQIIRPLPLFLVDLYEDFYLLAIWKPRREPWNHEWIGEPR